MSLDQIRTAIEEAPAGDHFDPAEVAALPEPARRYLTRCVVAGTPLSTCAELEMEGRFRTSPNAKWMPMRAREVLSRHGYLWTASIGGLVRISGHDSYAGGQAEMRWKLWGLFSVMRATGDDLARSARGRLAAELASWVPATLLPRFGTRWEALGDNSARVTLTIHGETIPVDLDWTPAGDLVRVELSRWGNYGTEGGAYEPIRFSGRCGRSQPFGGYTIPAEICCGWRPGSRAGFEFFDATLRAVRFR